MEFDVTAKNDTEELEAVVPTCSDETQDLSLAIAEHEHCKGPDLSVAKNQSRKIPWTSAAENSDLEAMPPDAFERLSQRILAGFFAALLRPRANQFYSTPLLHLGPGNFLSPAEST
jgi:hypothetical protein